MAIPRGIKAYGDNKTRIGFALHVWSSSIATEHIYTDPQLGWNWDMRGVCSPGNDMGILAFRTHVQAVGLCSSALTAALRAH